MTKQETKPTYQYDLASERDLIALCHNASESRLVVVNYSTRSKEDVLRHRSNRVRFKFEVIIEGVKYTYSRGVNIITQSAAMELAREQSPGIEGEPLIDKAAEIRNHVLDGGWEEIEADFERIFQRLNATSALNQIILVGVI